MSFVFEEYCLSLSSKQTNKDTKNVLHVLVYLFMSLLPISSFPLCPFSLCLVCLRFRYSSFPVSPIFYIGVSAFSRSLSSCSAFHVFYRQFLRLVSLYRHSFLFLVFCQFLCHHFVFHFGILILSFFIYCLFISFCKKIGLLDNRRWEGEEGDKDRIRGRRDERTFVMKEERSQTGRK